MEQKTHRIYADGREFGQDFTRETAFRIARQWRKNFPLVKYTVRKIAPKKAPRA